LETNIKTPGRKDGGWGGEIVTLKKWSFFLIPFTFVIHKNSL